jgi:hypothetical protein
VGGKRLLARAQGADRPKPDGLSDTRDPLNVER